MDEDKIITIPLIAKENSDIRFLKIIKWLVILMLVSNLAWGTTWVVYWTTPSSSETISQECDDNGINNYIGKDGNIND